MMGSSVAKLINFIHKFNNSSIHTQTKELLIGFFSSLIQFISIHSEAAQLLASACSSWMREDWVWLMKDKNNSIKERNQLIFNKTTLISLINQIKRCWSSL